MILRVSPRSWLPRNIRERLKTISKPSASYPNIYHNIFPGQINARKSDSSIQWNNIEVKSVYIVFITGRCGSTLLTNLIKDTGLAGMPEEFLNLSAVSRLNKALQAQTATSYIERVATTRSSRSIFGIEIDWIHLRSLDSIVDIKKLLRPVRSRFIYMTRRDIVAQAWSYATARSTGVWQNYTARQSTEASPQPPALRDSDIWSEILLILEAEMNFELFFRKSAIQPLRIDYEMLITDKRGLLGKVLLHIGCDINSIVAKTQNMIDRTQRIGNSDFSEMLTFRQKYAEILPEVERQRGLGCASIRRRLIKANILVSDK